MKGQLNKGFLEYCILLIISKESTYGYEIIKVLEEYFDNILDSTVYTILRRFEKNEILKPKYVESENNRQKKYYELSDKGHTLLNDYDYNYNKMYSVMEDIKKNIK